MIFPEAPLMCHWELGVKAYQLFDADHLARAREVQRAGTGGALLGAILNDMIDKYR